MSVYRSPSTDSRAGLNELQYIVTELSLVSHCIVIVGDFNIDLCSSSTVATAYSEFVSDNNLTQHITEPSRVTATSATLIDHVLTTPNVIVSSVYQSVGLSDHLVQILDADLSVIRYKPITLLIQPFCVIGVLLGNLLQPLLARSWTPLMMLTICGTILRPLHLMYLMNMLLLNQSLPSFLNDQHPG